MNNLSPQTTITPLIGQKVKYCLYARKSTESEERQVLSIDSQVKEMLELATREGLDVVEIRREAHSAKATGQRPVFNELISDIRLGRFNGILTWAPDRISRNAGDLGAIVDLMDSKQLLEIRTFGQHFTNSPSEKFLLMILGSQAKLENDNRGVNVKRGLRTRVEMGLWPNYAPLGYLNPKTVDGKGRMIIDPVRGPIIKQMFERVAFEHKSGRDLYHWLRFDIHFYTRGNKPLTLSGIYRILDNTFYYGSFEYPRESGKWYQGKHEPLVTQEVFQQAQTHLKRDQIVRENKEFAFTKLFTCGFCGSGISAEEKYKQLKNGTSAKYIYYGCNRSRDRFCKNSYIREEALIQELLKIIDQLEIHELGIKNKLNEEIQRFKKFQSVVSGITSIEKVPINDLDTRMYIKYLLKEGSTIEKREILGNLRSKLLYKNGQISANQLQ